MLAHLIKLANNLDDKTYYNAASFVDRLVKIAINEQLADTAIWLIHELNNNPSEQSQVLIKSLEESLKNNDSNELLKLLSNEFVINISIDAKRQLKLVLEDLSKAELRALMTDLVALLDKMIAIVKAWFGNDGLWGCTTKAFINMKERAKIILNTADQYDFIYSLKQFSWDAVAVESIKYAQIQMDLTYGDKKRSQTSIYPTKSPTNQLSLHKMKRDIEDFNNLVKQYSIYQEQWGILINNIIKAAQMIEDGNEV